LIENDKKLFTVSNDNTEPGKKRSRESPPQVKKEKDFGKTRRGKNDNIIEDVKLEKLEVRIETTGKKEDEKAPVSVAVIETEEKKKNKRARRI
jgi:hypothetical protein